MSTYLEIYTTNLTPARNALVDDIATYLSERITTPSFEIQYQKIALDMSVKVAMAQERITKQSVGNYCSIKQDDMTYYYFITSAQWTSANTILLSISIDSINTFRDWVTFSSKTNVIREHRDRFTNIQPYAGATMTLKRKIDDVDEGINGSQYMTSANSIASSTGDWCIVYQTSTESSTAVSCRLYPVSAVIPTGIATIKGNSDLYDVLRATESFVYLTSRYNSGAKVTFNNTTYNVDDYAWMIFQIVKVSGEDYVTIYAATFLADGGYTLTTIYHNIVGTLKFERTKVVHVAASDNEYKTYDDLLYNTLPVLFRSGLITLQRFVAVDRTSTKLLKIISCGYCPIDLNYDSNGYLITPDGWYVDVYGTLIKSDLDKTFSKTLDNVLKLPLNETLYEGTLDELKYAKRDDKFESKLYHSSFYTYKLAYDSYSTTIDMERISSWTSTMLSVNFKQSDNISSDCGFKIDSTSVLTYRAKGDYDMYIISTRNNESPIYTSEYLNYLRTGYNYDKKNQVASNWTSWVAAGASIAGAIGSFASGAVTGGISLIAAMTLATTAITTLTTAITNTISQDQSIHQKIEQSKAQATQVVGSDDLSLLNWYSGNTLWVRTYSISDALKNQVADLFYYCGYATNQHKVPDINSRYWFNYIQCNLDIGDIQESPLITDFYDDIKARYSAGVTVYHRNNNEYDWDQQYENWEVDFIG